MNERDYAKRPLAGVSVLIVEDDEDTGDIVTMALESRGADCRLATTGATAIEALKASTPNVILCDLSLPDGSGIDWLERFRTISGVENVPAVAVTGRASKTDRARSLGAGFAKHLVKPVTVLDLVAAISILANRHGALALKETLARLSQTTGCRYTSFLRFDQDVLVSIWTYDRTSEANDPFPLRMPIEASYCQLVRREREQVVIENAAEDPRAEGHLKRDSLATYVGTPVFGADGGIFGTLCSYDEAPMRISDDAREAVTKAARELESAIAAAL